MHGRKKYAPSPRSLTLARFSPLILAQGVATVTNVDEVVEILRDAKSCIIVPGYGVAVAKVRNHPSMDLSIHL